MTAARHPSAVLNGRRVEPGTELSIQGARGRYRFVELVTTDRSEWITVYGGPDGHGQFRSFPPSRVRTVHRVTKLRSV